MDGHNTIVKGDLVIRDRLIESVGATGEGGDVVIDATDCVVLPGFIQTHIHLCQTLFRGAADDLALIDWLKKRVWPMEAAHTAESVRASARLGIAELIKGGTTCALTMETVNHTEHVFRAVEETGFRATVGKCMMDQGGDVPDALQEESEQSIAESLSLLNDWHGAAQGRISYCFAPRFAVSCTTPLLSAVGKLARQHGVLVHTHASENLTECQMVEQATGLSNIAYLDSVGLTGNHVVLAHCVHVNDAELKLLKDTGTNVSHCPSSNLKLGSGIARIAEMLDADISVSLGADGAACNNRLDMFTEMRTAALLQKALHGPEVLPAQTALRMATIDGARALGLKNKIGSLEVGKFADVIVVRLNGLHSTPYPSEIVSAVVYALQPADVDTVVIDGEVVLHGGELKTLSEAEVRAEAQEQSRQLQIRTVG